jgi:hypothetical protein
MAIVAYYISEAWQYKEVLIGFEPLRGVHSGRNLAQVVEWVLLNYGLAERLFAITTDDASNYGTLRESLGQVLSGFLYLSAKSLLLGIKIASEANTGEAVTGDSAESQAAKPLSPEELVPELAENYVARTVVKVRRMPPIIVA